MKSVKKNITIKLTPCSSQNFFLTAVCFSAYKTQHTTKKPTNKTTPFFNLTYALLSLFFCFSIFAQKDSIALYVAPNTIISGLNQVFVVNAVDSDSERNTLLNTISSIQEQNEPLIFVEENTVFYSNQNLKVVYFSANAKKEIIASKSNINKKIKIVFHAKKQPTKEKHQTSIYYPFSSNSSKGLYSAWYNAVVLAPSSPNAKKIRDTAIIIASQYLINSVAHKQNNRITTHTKPLIVNMTFSYYQNRPPPGLV